MIGTVINDVAASLRTALGVGTNVSDSTPATNADLPSVTLGAREVTSRLVGVGRIPRGTRTGALRLFASINLADPRLELLDGDFLDLLDPTRRELTLPNGPLVRADGTSDTPFTADDVSAADPTPFPVSTALNPSGRRFRPLPDEGIFRFGIDLAATGTLLVSYHVGQWDVIVTRYQGLLDVTTTAANAAGLTTLSNAVESAMDALGRTPTPGATGSSVTLTPRARLAATASPPGSPGGNARVRQLIYQFDAEIEAPLLTSGGGVISRVNVRAPVTSAGDPDVTAEETFAITHEAGA